MKTDSTIPLHLNSILLAEAAKNSQSKEPNLTPYLKAILTGAVNLVNAGKASIASHNHDLEAAIRYIRESGKLKK